MAKRQRFTEQQLNSIYDRTSGRCHICHARLSFNNYGRYGARQAWQIEHSIPLANGGTNHANNLYAACIACNLEKSTVTSRTARAWNGRRRAPLSRSKYQEARNNNAIGTGMIGAGIGAVLGGPAGAFIGGLLGVALGHDIDPND